MFQKTRSIEKSFQHIRIFTLVIIIGAFGVCTFTIYQTTVSETSKQNRIYVLLNGKAIEAIAGDRKDNIPVEARDHVKMFHHYFFTLDPDEKVIQCNIGKALYLADGSAKRQYEDLKENGYYSNIIAGNISQKIVVDSVAVNLEQYPYYFRCFATQEIIRTTSTVTRSLITEGYLRNVNRSDNNSHGFLVEKWNTIENRDLKTVTR